MLIGVGCMLFIFNNHKLWHFYEAYQEVRFELGWNEYWFLFRQCFYILFPAIYGAIELRDSLKVNKHRL
jgi:hypothetical protein